MSVNTISFLASFTYFAASFLQFLYLFGKLIPSKSKWMSIGLAAVGLHGYVLYRWIDTPQGQNLSLSHMFSLVCWLITLATVFISFISSKKSIENLILFILPIAAFSIFLCVFFPGSDLFQTKNHPQTLIHIFISTLAFGILALAALQATLLYVQNKLLKNHTSNLLIRILPPLETMETLLFQIVWIGFFLLSIALLSVFFFQDYLFLVNRLQKIIFSLLAWGLFALLLYKHHQTGLRGTKAIQWTLGGVFLLMIAYLAGKWLHKIDLINLRILSP